MRELVVPLRLTDVRDLFRPADIDPLAERHEPYLDQPALEHVVAMLFAHPRAKRIRLEIALPREKLADDLGQRTCAAIRRYSEGRAMAARDASARARYYGRRSAVVAVIALFFVLGTSVRLSASSNEWESLVGTGLGVVGWVLLWYPLDTLTYEVWTERVERRAYEALQNVDLRFLPDDGPG